MSNAERELTDLKLEFVNFVKKIRAFLRFFNAVFNEKSRRVSMSFLFMLAQVKTSFLKRNVICALGFIIESLGGLNFH